MKKSMKCGAWLLARVCLVAMLSFMSFTLTAFVSTNILVPIFAVFYTLMLAYFFVFTMWTEGNSDTNKVKIGLMSEMKSKGFMAAAAVLLPLIIINLITLLMPAAIGTVRYREIFLSDNVYNISFDYSGTSYEYTVDAVTGEVSKRSEQQSDKSTASFSAPGNFYSDTLYANGIEPADADFISSVLEDGYFLLTFRYDGNEYVYKIDPSTGEKISFEKNEIEYVHSDVHVITPGVACEKCTDDSGIGLSGFWSVFSVVALLSRAPTLYVYYLTSGNNVSVVIAVCAVYAVCIVLAGAAYLIGYRKINLGQWFRELIKQG